MDTESVWENPLEGLTKEARLCRVLAAAAELEAERRDPTQRAIAEKLGCSTQWSVIDRDLGFARDGFVDGRPIKALSLAQKVVEQTIRTEVHLPDFT